MLLNVSTCCCFSRFLKASNISGTIIFITTSIFFYLKYCAKFSLVMHQLLSARFITFMHRMHYFHVFFCREPILLYFDNVTKIENMSQIVDGSLN